MKRKRKDIRRKIGQRPVRNRIFIYTEGKSTEPQYLEAYAKAYRSHKVEIIIGSQHGVPKTLFELGSSKIDEISSRKYLREFGEGDSVWLVFDRDEHVDFELVLSRCKSKGIKVALSNPCFEIWLILHMEDYDRDEHRNDTQKRCEELCPGYSVKSGKVPSLEKILPQVEKAEERAIKLFQRREADGGTAPLTTMFRLTTAIRRD